MKNVANLTKDFFSIREAAQRLGIGRSLLYRLLDAGEIKTAKIGARRLIPADALNEFIARVKSEAA